jgi:hypothetical protein
MRKIVFIFTTIVLLSASAYLKAGCPGGGPGSSAYSYSASFLWGLFSITYTVTCKDGYYACCSSNSGTCISESASSKNTGLME